MADLKPGDEVRVFDVNGRRAGQPDGGWPGEVVSVGRTLVTILYRGRPEKFRLDTRRRNDDYQHQSFMTPAEVALQERHAAAMSVLRERGLQVEYGHSLSLELAEALAATIETFGQEG